MKTAAEHFEKLMPGYRERALLRRQEFPIDGINFKYFTLQSALASFEWERTKEGYDFWISVYYFYHYGHPLPALPP